ERLASVEYDPDKAASSGPEEQSTRNAEKTSTHHAWGFDPVDLSERLQRIGEELCDPGRLGKAIQEFRLRNQPPAPPTDVAPGNARQTALLNIWRKVLGRPRIGLHDNFFEAGGTSLRAVQVIAMIKKELKKTLSIVSLFECPTVALLAAKLSAMSGETYAGSTTAVAALRGQRRRYKAMSQHAS